MDLLLTMLLALAPVIDDAGRPTPSEPPESCSRAKNAVTLADWRAEAELLKNIDDPESEKTDVHHYRLDFEIDPEAQTLSGTTVMTVASRVEDLSTFRFWLGASMTISLVEVDGEEAAWQRSDGAIVDVELDHNYDAGEVFEISISCAGTPETPGIFQNQEDGTPVISAFTTIPTTLTLIRRKASSPRCCMRSTLSRSRWTTSSSRAL